MKDLCKLQTERIIKASEKLGKPQYGCEKQFSHADENSSHEAQYNTDAIVLARDNCEILSIVATMTHAITMTQMYFQELLCQFLIMLIIMRCYKYAAEQFIFLNNCRHYFRSFPISP